MIAGETLAGRTERMRRDAAATAMAEARRKAALDAASAASHASPPVPPAPLSTPSSAAPAAAQPAPAIVDPERSHQPKECFMSDTAIQLKRVTVALSAPVLWFDKLISEVVLQEPTAANLFAIGEPVVFVGSANGGSFAEVPEAMTAYLDRCLMVENGSAFLGMLGVRDGKAIKKALLSFFQAEPEAAPT